MLKDWSPLSTRKEHSTKTGGFVTEVVEVVIALRPGE